MKTQTYWVVVDPQGRLIDGTIRLRRSDSTDNYCGPHWADFRKRGYTVRKCRIELVPEAKR